MAAGFLEKYRVTSVSIYNSKYLENCIQKDEKIIRSKPNILCKDIREINIRQHFCKEMENAFLKEGKRSRKVTLYRKAAEP